MKLPDPCMPASPPCERNYFLACYAVSLAQGENLRNKIIRGSTISNYLTAVGSLLDDRELQYECKDDFLGTILKSLTDYDNVEERRHMICDDMMLWLHKEAQQCDIDSPFAATVDWIKLGRYGGFRKSEWCQSTQSKYDRIAGWPGKPSLAFVWGDFTFFDKHRRRLDFSEITEDNVYFVRIRWRKQKNNDNGQEITYARDEDLPAFCPALAALRIVQRAMRLGSNPAEPLGVARHPKSRRRIYITDAITATVLRSAAQAVYKLSHDDPELKRWSCHSIRVTAANLLHRERFSDSYIQVRLRWKSTSFLKYLRNTFYAAAQHTRYLKLSDSNLPPPEERVYREAYLHEQITDVFHAAAA